MALFNEATMTPYADQAGQLNLFADELEPIASGAAEAAGAMEQFGEQAGAAGEEAGEAGKNIEELQENFERLFEKVAEYSGIYMILRSVREAAEDAFQSFSREERAKEAFAALTGNAEEADRTIERLQQTALRLAIPYKELLYTQQEMTAAFKSTEGAVELIPRIMVAAADASRATGSSFGAVAGSLERMAQAGIVSSRYLISLGLSLQDLAKSTGIATSGIERAWRGMTVTERLEAFAGALQKYKGTSEATANDLTGTWDRLKDQAEISFGEAIKAIEPLIKEFTEGATEITRLVAEAITEVANLGTEISKLPATVQTAMLDVAVALKSPSAATALSLLQLASAFHQYREAADDAAAASDQQSHKLAEMQTALAQTFSRYPAYMAQLRELQRQYGQGEISQEAFISSLDKLTTEFRQANPAAAPASKLGALADEAQEKWSHSVEGMKAKVRELQEEIKELSKTAGAPKGKIEPSEQIAAIDKIRELSAEEKKLEEQIRVASQDPAAMARKSAESEIRAKQEALKTWLSVEKSLIDTEVSLRGDSEDQKLALIQKAADAEYEARRDLLSRELALDRQDPLRPEKAAADMAAINRLDAEHAAQAIETQNKITLARQKAADAERKAADEAAEKEEEAAAKSQEFLQSIFDREVQAGLASATRSNEQRIAADETYAQAKEAHEQRMLDMAKDRIESERALGEISGRQEIEMLKRIQEAAYQAELAAAAAKLHIAEQSGNPEQIARAQANMQAAIDRNAAAMQKLNERQAQEYQRVWAGTFQQVAHQSLSTFNEILTGQMRLGAGLRKLTKDIEMDFLEMFEQILIKDQIQRAARIAGEATVGKLMQAMHLGQAAQDKAQQAAVAESQVATEASVSGAAATADALMQGDLEGALAVGTAMEGAVEAAFGATAAAAGGFDVGFSAPLTQLHPREMVLPADLSSGIRDMVSSGKTGGGSIQLHYHAGANESPQSIAGNEKALARMIRRMVRTGRLAIA